MDTQKRKREIEIWGEQSGCHGENRTGKSES